MRISRLTEEQIAHALREVEAGKPVKEVIRRLGISEQTFYRWKRKFEGMRVAELRRLLSRKKTASLNAWSRI